MRFSVVIDAIAALAAVVGANPLAWETRHVIHEEHQIHRRSDWVRFERAHRSQVLPVRIGLAQQNLHKAEEYINAVSHPDSPDYGKHWSPEKVAEIFAPRKETIQAVREWLQKEGIQPKNLRLSKGRNWLHFKAKVEEVERLLKTEYHYYRHHSGATHLACSKYHVPSHLTEHIDLITPTVHFDQRLDKKGNKKILPVSDEETRELKKRALSKRQRPESGLLGSGTDSFSPKQGAEIKNALVSLDQCDQLLTLDCIRALYDIPPGSLSASNNTMGIAEFTPQAFLQPDLDMFFSEFSPDIPQKQPIIQAVDNGVVQTQNQSFNLNGESALDLEIAMGLISPQTATVFQVGDLQGGGSLGNLLDALDGSYCNFMGGDSKDPNVDGQYPESVRCGTHKATNVISVSYGSNEGDFGVRYEMRQCLEYMKLGLQGITMVFSSGDDGVAGNGGLCINPITGAYNNGSSGSFNPAFPSTCPYITSVGATQILNGSSVRSPENACEEVIFSGGGFSNTFAMPSYQKSSTANFFQTSTMKYTSNQFNDSQTVRGYPDVAANGARYVTAVNGKFRLSFGTSAAAPVFASMINMINEKRLQNDKSPVGFINNVLYNNPQIMNDITNGNNPGCGTKGFSAVPGWDPVTGLGTPNYPAMESLFLNLP